MIKAGTYPCTVMHTHAPHAPMQDVLDLRANNWVPRTKKEGPKKIADVHREAKSELMMQVGKMCYGAIYKTAGPTFSVLAKSGPAQVQLSDEKQLPPSWRVLVLASPLLWWQDVGCWLLLGLEPGSRA